MPSLPHPPAPRSADGPAGTDGEHDSGAAAPLAGSQIKSRARVRDLAEVYTNKREVDAMLDLVAAMFPSPEYPDNIDRTFLEPACGSGNFLEEILRRKLAVVTTRRHGCDERYEHGVLRCLASIYGIDICQENVDQSRERMRALISSHLDNDRATGSVSPALGDAAEVILRTNIIRADALADARAIVIVEYCPGTDGTFIREWSSLDPEAGQPSLFSVSAGQRDEVPVHYSELSSHPGPLLARIPMKGAA